MLAASLTTLFFSWQASRDIATKPVAFDAARTGLQVNVGAPSLGGIADKVGWI